jgi:predicted regulator of Ras-like GTPase activity (Roadblock/LC7/MglB family)
MNSSQPRQPWGVDEDTQAASLLEALHHDVEEFTKDVGDVFVFATDGRVIDKSRGIPVEVAEAAAARFSGLVNYSRRYASLVNHEEMDGALIGYGTGYLILLPISDVVWAGTFADHSRLGDTTHRAALFTDRVRHLVPQRITLGMHILPSALQGKHP